MKTLDSPDKTADEQTDAAFEAPGKRANRKPFFLGLLVVLVLLAAVYGYRYFSFASTHVSTDDAFITSDVIQVAPQVSGTITKLMVDDNEQVKKGQLIAVLDESTYRAAVEQAKANLDLAVAQAEGAKTSTGLTAATGSAQIAQAQGGVEQATGGVGAALADVSRASAGVQSARANALSAEASVKGANAALANALASRRRAVSAVNGAQALVRSAQANVRNAQAAVVSAEANAKLAAQEAERSEKLVSEGVISAQQAERARAALSVAQAQADSAQEQVAAASDIVQQRQADLQAARDQVQVADSAIAQARAQIAASQGQASAANQGVRQAEAQRLAAQQNVASAKGKTGQAQGQLEQAKTVRRQVEVSKNAESQAQAKIEQARAALQAAQINLEHTRIFAPANGLVSKKTATVGALVQPGTPLLAIIPSQSVWIVANFKETQLANLKVGQQVDVDVDALPGHPFHGRVDSISAGTGSTFALLPADNASGNFTKVVQRIPVKMAFDPGQPDLDRLRVGMSVNATVQTK